MFLCFLLVLSTQRRLKFSSTRISYKGPFAVYLRWGLLLPRKALKEDLSITKHLMQLASFLKTPAGLYVYRKRSCWNVFDPNGVECLSSIIFYNHLMPLASVNWILFYVINICAFAVVIIAKLLDGDNTNKGGKNRIVLTTIQNE